MILAAAVTLPIVIQRVTMVGEVGKKEGKPDSQGKKSKALLFICWTPIVTGIDKSENLYIVQIKVEIFLNCHCL